MKDLVKEMKQDVEMLSLLLDTASKEMLDTKKLMLKDLSEVIYDSYLEVAYREKCIDPRKTAKSCTDLELKVLAKKPLTEIYQEYKFYMNNMKSAR